MSDQSGNYYGGGQPNSGQYPAQGQPPSGQWSDPNAGYQQQQYSQPDPVVYNPPPVAPVRSGSSGGKKSSPLFPILLGLAVIAAAVLAILWHSATSDADTAKKTASDAQAQIATVTKKAATDVATAKKATDSIKAEDQAAIDAANAAAAKAKADGDAAVAKAQADAAAAVAKAQADSAAAIAQAKTDAGSASGDLQKKLDAANAALAAEQAKGAANITSLQICQAFAKTANDLVPDLNNFVALAAGINNNNTAAAQAALNAINASGFDSNKNTFNDALNQCLATPAA